MIIFLLILIYYKLSYLIISYEYDNSESQMKLLQTLVELGADPCCKTKQLETPFHKACSKCSLEIIELLLEYGSDPHAVTRYFFTF
jgi:ankyrin repeat protein